MFIVLILSLMNPMCALWRFILISCLHLWLCLPSVFFPSHFSTKTMCISLLPHTCHMHHPSLLPWCHHPNNTWCGVQIMKILSVEFSPVSCYLLPLKPKYLPQHLILDHPQPVFFPFRWDQVSHPCKTTCKIKFLSISVFMFFDPPSWYPYFDRVVGLAWWKDPGNYAGSSITGRAIHARQVKGDDPHEKRYPGPPGWGLDVRLPAPHKKLMLRKPQRCLRQDW